MSDLLSSISSPMLDITSKANYDEKKKRKETGLMERSIMKALLVAAAPLSAASILGVLRAIIAYRCTCEHYG